MPIPTPSKDEDHDEFMERCMGNDTMVEEYPDDDQRHAVCQSSWDENKDEANSAPVDDGQIERRVCVAEDAGLEIRAQDGKDPTIRGYAAKFGKWSEDLGGFREKIAVGAFDGVLSDDVRCLRNHNPDLLLGRTTAGTLTMKANKTGLRFENTPPNTVTGRETVESIKRGDITGCSFSFMVEEDEWHEDKDDNLTRIIRKVGRLWDIGPVTFPAYPDTTVAARSMEAWKAQRAQEAGDSITIGTLGDGKIKVVGCTANGDTIVEIRKDEDTISNDEAQRQIAAVEEEASAEKPAGRPNYDAASEAIAEMERIQRAEAEKAVFDRIAKK